MDPTEEDEKHGPPPVVGSSGGRPDEGAPKPLHPGLNDYAQKICPIFSLAVAKAPTRSLVQPAGPLAVDAPVTREGEMDVSACLGPRCAWFLTEKDEKGRILGGGCAVLALPILERHTLDVSRGGFGLLDHVLSRLKIHR